MAAEKITILQFFTKKTTFIKKFSILDTPWHNWLVLGSESPNIICFVLFGILSLQETFNNKKWRAGSPQSLYSLAQFTPFVFRVSQQYLLCLIWDFKTSGDIQQQKMEGWKSSISIFPGTIDSFWVQSLQTFFVWRL
jgi:hypothetical protein